jgi:hypothetical protein
MILPRVTSLEKQGTSAPDTAASSHVQEGADVW